jgi:ABC-type tungstate transport system permease subunit
MPIEVKVNIASTTSVGNSGLATNAIDVAFETSQTGNPTIYTLNWTFVGSGAAMQRARNGLAEIVLTHDRINELIFKDVEKYALSRKWVFYNYFIFVGPRVGGTITGTTLEDCFIAVKNTSSSSQIFVSRGPDGLAGTYVREMQIWKQLGLSAQPGSVYSPANDPGMLGTLNYASANGKYTLTDIGTWYAYLDQNGGSANAPLMALTSKFGGANEDKWASNQYVLMPINPDADGLTLDPDAVAGADFFLKWMIGYVAGNPTAASVVNGYKPDGTNQGFFYNADQAEKFPLDGTLIQPIQR